MGTELRIYTNILTYEFVNSYIRTDSYFGSYRY